MVMGEMVWNCCGAICGGENASFVCVHDSAQRFTIVLKLVEEEFYIFDRKEAICVVNIGHDDWFATILIIKVDTDTFSVSGSEE